MLPTNSQFRWKKTVDLGFWATQHKIWRDIIDFWYHDILKVVSLVTQVRSGLFDLLFCLDPFQKPQAVAFLPRMNSKEKNEGWPERNRLWVNHTRDGCMENKGEKKLREYVFFVLYPHKKTWYIWYHTSVYLYIYTYIWYICTSTIPVKLSIRFQSPPFWFRLPQSKGGSQLATLNSAPVDRQFILSIIYRIL